MNVDSLSKTDRKILAAAAECGSKKLTVSGIAKIAGCSPAHVCKKLTDPEFKQLFSETLRTSLITEVPEILHAFVLAGKQGVFKHGKLILEMSGVHQDKQRVEIDGHLSSGDSPFKDDEERKAFLKATVEGFLSNHETKEKER